jgi:Tfp pilus assembly protein PilF
MGGGPIAGWAETSLTRALQIDSRLVDARTALGGLYLDRGRLDEAVQVLRGAVAMDESHTPSYEALGRALLARGEPGAAADAFARAATNDPEMPEALMGHGRALCADGKLEEGSGRIRAAEALAERQGDVALAEAASSAIAACVPGGGNR